MTSLTKTWSTEPGGVRGSARSLTNATQAGRSLRGCLESTHRYSNRTTIPVSGSGNSSEDATRLVKQLVQIVVPRVHLCLYQFAGKIGWQFSKPVGPRARGLLETLEFIDRHQHMSPTASMRDRDGGLKRRILHFP